MTALAAGGGAAARAGLVPLQTTHPGLVPLSFSVEGNRRSRVARMRRSVWGGAHWLQRGGRGGRCWFVTLTYRPGCSWEPEHVTGYMNRLRKWCGVRGVVKPRYVWVAELQARGAMHYHVAVWLPRSLSLPLPDKSGMWPHGMSQRALAIAPIGYLMKYVSKGDTPFHQFPKGARIYGLGGLCPDGRAVRSWLNLPEWAKTLHGVGEVSRAKRGLVVRDTGEILASPYEVEHMPGGLLLRVVGELPPRFHAGPYSTLRAAA